MSSHGSGLLHIAMISSCIDNHADHTCETMQSGTHGENQILCVRQSNMVRTKITHVKQFNQVDHRSHHTCEIMQPGRSHSETNNMVDDM